MLTGSWVTQALYVAAKLGIADLVEHGPRTATELAAATGAQASTLHRLLRALAGLGVFVEDPARRFALTPLAERLLSNRPDSQRSMAILLGEERYRAWGELLDCVQSGEPAFPRLYGMRSFEYLSAHPEQARVFDEAMVGVHGRETAAMLAAYDFATMHTLADIGGGNGSLLIATLTQHPHLRGLLFDLPGVIERARPQIVAAGLAERCELVSGSFFDEVPSGADAYLARHIVHDWSDHDALAILRNVCNAMSPTARLLLVEGVIPADNEPSFTKFLDLNMLVMHGGLERTAAEYGELLGNAGLRLDRIIPTASEISILEARRTS